MSKTLTRAWLSVPPVAGNASIAWLSDVRLEAAARLGGAMSAQVALHATFGTKLATKARARALTESWTIVLGYNWVIFVGEMTVVYLRENFREPG